MWNIFPCTQCPLDIHERRCSKSRTAPHDRSHRKTDHKNIPETNEVTHVKRFCLGKFDLCTDFSLINTGTIRFPFLSGNGREYNTFLFQTVDSFAFCCICKWNLWIASEGVIRKITKLSCIESAAYNENTVARKTKHPGKIVHRRSETGEMLYIAWGNITRQKARFIITSLSIFLGVLSFILMNVLTNGCDYKHLLEKRPDFLLAGEFSEWGKSQGCGEEYKTIEIDVDPLLTQGGGVELLYDNDYDEFSPISRKLEKKLHEIDGIDWENSNLIEGAYVTTVMSKKGIRPYDEGLSNLTNDNMVEGFSWDTVQV